jgi:hypothetical protein
LFGSQQSVWNKRGPYTPLTTLCGCRDMMMHIHISYIQDIPVCLTWSAEQTGSLMEWSPTTGSNFGLSISYHSFLHSSIHPSIHPSINLFRSPHLSPRILLSFSNCVSWEFFTTSFYLLLELSLISPCLWAGFHPY